MKPRTSKIEKKMHPAVVLGGSSAGSLAVIRDLSRYNIPLFAVDSSPHSVFLYSRYCEKHISPDPRTDEEGYIDFLRGLGATFTSKAVLFPSGDIETRVILKYKDRLLDYYEFISSNFEITDLFLNKKKFYTLLKEQHIPHPKTFFPESIDSVKDICNNIQFPCVLKPMLSAYFTSEFKKKVFIAYSKERLISYFRLASEKNIDVLIQEIVPVRPGEVIMIDSFVDSSSQLVETFCFKRIRSYPYKFGVSCYVERTTESNLKDILSTLVKQVGYVGLIDAEFVKDARDGTYRFIEINPRVWMQMGYPSLYGINFSLMSYLHALGEYDPKTMKWKREPVDGKEYRWLYLFYDLRACYMLLRHKKLSIDEWIRSYIPHKTYGVFSKKDPLPGIILFASTLFGLVLIIFKWIIRK